MIAVVLATGLNPELGILNERYPTPLLQVVDRPFIQHVIEFLAEEGVHRFEFILNHLPEKIEKFLGDGSRWGCSFRFHLTRDAEKPYEGLKQILVSMKEGEGDGDPIIIVHADRLPYISLKDIETSDSSVAFCIHDANGESAWSGWALVSAQLLESLPADCDENRFADYILSSAKDGGKIIDLAHILDIRSYRGFLEAHKKILEKQFQGLFLSGRETDEGIWLSRNIALHPGVKLTPPVYIGENCRIDRGSHLGPCAVIGRDCVISSGCTIKDSVIFPRSYVGEGLELNEVIVDKNRLINARIGVSVTITEHFILGGLSPKHLSQRFVGIFSRLLGAILLVLFSPVIILTAFCLKVFRKGPVLYKKEVVRLPAGSDDSTWRTFELWSFASFDGSEAADGKKRSRQGLREFLLKFLPGLVNVVKGEMRLVGVAPRTREEILSLDEDWRDLYVRTKAGLITESFVQYGAYPTEDELFSAEVFYSAMGGVVHDFKLALGYIERILGRRIPASAE